MKSSIDLGVYFCGLAGSSGGRNLSSLGSSQLVIFRIILSNMI